MTTKGICTNTSYYLREEKETVRTQNRVGIAVGIDQTLTKYSTCFLIFSTSQQIQIYFLHFNSKLVNVQKPRVLGLHLELNLRNRINTFFQAVAFSLIFLCKEIN